LFSAAYNYIKSKERLHLYGLYKQATKGKCNRPKPRFWEINASRKWNAWDRFQALTKDEAKRQYIDFVDDLKLKAEREKRLRT
jgi:acyl-CoA-binding protein